MRASDADRDAVVERLREAAAEGRIDLAELGERLDQALTAKTHDDLASLTADLPPAARPDPGRPLVLRGGYNGASRTGHWHVPSRIAAYGGGGGVKLDFTRANCTQPEVEVEVDGQMGGITIVIPEGWAADTAWMKSGLGGFTDKTTGERRPGTPLIHLRGTGGMAGVVIRHPNAWERRKLRQNKPR